MSRIPTFKEVGERIRKLREQKGQSQQQLACFLGVTRPVVTKIEGGNKAINAQELRLIADFLDTTVDILLQDVEDEELVVKFRKAGVIDDELAAAVSRIDLVMDEVIGQLDIWRNNNG